MAPNRPKRGKNPSQIKESVVNMTVPSTIMHSLLQKLDLTFERDIGMLNGKNTNSIPPTETLVAVQKQLTQLKQLFESISDNDREYIDKIRTIRENKAKESARLKLEAAEAERAKEEAAVSAATAAAASTAASEAKAREVEALGDVKDETEDKIDILPSSAPASPEKVKATPTDKSDETTPNEGERETAERSAIPSEKSKDDILMADGQEKPETQADGTSKPESSQEEHPKSPSVTQEQNDEGTTSTADSVQDETNAKKRGLEDEAANSTETSKTDQAQEGNDANTAQTEEPPVKKQKQDEVDIDQMENDPNVKNPKSEFVISQTLPRAARNLGLYSEEGLESTGEEYLKKKYSVASYPTTDLKELLPGDMPDMDLSCAKPANQIQFSTFLSYVDNFFKELTEDDIKLLKTKYILPANLEVDKTYDADVTPFVIPKLGPLYTRTWFKADANKKVGNISPPNVSDTSSIVPKKGANAISDAVLETEDISCGPLLSRLLSAIFRDEGTDVAKTIAQEENNTSAATNQDTARSIDVKVENNNESSNNLGIENHEQTPGPSAAETPFNSNLEEMTKFSMGGTTSTLKMDQGWKINSVNLDYPTLEERLKRELKYVGIYANLPKDENNASGDDPDWLTGREDDEVSAELRELQNSLKQSTSRNQKRKEVLTPLIEKQLAWLEYSSILDDLDKQVDQAYIKRVRVPKKRKKHHSSGGVNTGTASQLAQQKAANSSLKALLDKRQRWITKIGPLFGPSELMKRIPKRSIFADLEQDDDDDEGDEGDVFDHNDHEGKDADDNGELET